MGDGATQGPAQVVAAACDGACSGNPGPGGWGALLRFSDGSVHELGGAEGATTNNRMELTAALALLRELRELPRDPGLVIRTDSRYLIDGLQKWLPGWKRKGWRTASGGAVLNRDLWEQLDGSRIRGLELQHVRGHSGDPDNDRCDAIAVAFSRGQRPQLEVGERLTSAGLEAGRPSAPLPSSPAAKAVQTDLLAAAPSDPAPPALGRLLERLEVADRLARGGYALNLVELAQLVDLPLRQLESRSSAWTWRDWLVQPLGDGRWRLDRGAGGLAQPE
ncbi:MAG: ribonuclease HI [Cyanobacteria bacterium]|jgi:ribonuclease HI|nr:ribonuclease HI [Cyanobacteriota bacterium]